MATRSLIGILDKTDNTVRYIYCHWDGYTAYMGKMLLTHYNDPEKINNLLDFGDMSSIKENISTDKPHTFDNPQENVCVFYGRDRGEKDVGYKVCKLNEYLTEADSFGVDYCYLYDNDWLCNHKDSNHFTSLTLADCHE